MDSPHEIGMGFGTPCFIIIIIYLLFIFFWAGYYMKQNLTDQNFHLKMHAIYEQEWCYLHTCMQADFSYYLENKIDINYVTWK